MVAQLVLPYLHRINFALPSFQSAVAPLVVADQNCGTNSAKTSPTASSKAANQSSGRRTDTIYGCQLMPPDERAAYRENMLTAKTPDERERLRAEHHKEMQARAKGRHGTWIGIGAGKCTYWQSMII